MSEKRKQCAHCPWKVSTDPERDIPGGYSVEKHRALENTIATPGEMLTPAPLRKMACHETAIGEEKVCVGWLVNQLHAGNNIPLRLRAMTGEFDDIELSLSEPQHSCFHDTLPKKKRAKR